MTKNRKIECRCQCHHKHECYFGKTPCVKCGHDFASSTPEPSEWERELGNLLTKMSEHYLIDDEFESELKWFISTLLAQREKKLRERIGMLRQWLNEDRIKDAKYFVTNESIERWLDIPLSEAGEKREEVRE